MHDPDFNPQPSSPGSASAPSAAPDGRIRRRAKVLTREQLLARRREARAMGLAVVQCHGCFDIVHPGHIRHLRQARSHGDILLVSITGDASYAKRGGQPLIPQELRAENLAELDCVDWVYIDDHDTALTVLETVKPDVYIKGREYETNRDPRFAAERAAVERSGGRVVFSSGDVVFSSTALIAQLERTADPFQARLGQLLAEPSLDGARLTGLISGFRDKRVVVIGETISDVYVLCDRPEVASESPVLTLRPLEKRTYDGGAAIIARHIAAMGGRPLLITGLPETPEAHAVRHRLLGEGVEVWSVPLTGRLAEKQRFLVGAQKVMKLNALEPIVLDAGRQDELVAMASEAVTTGGFADAAVIADFGNGLLSPGLVGRLCRAVRPHVGVLAGDVSGRKAALGAFVGADLLCPSESEAREGLRSFDEGLAALAWRLMHTTRTGNVLLKMGPEGLIAFAPLAEAEGGSAGAPAADTAADGFRSRVKGEHVPALGGHAVDPLGCGDALLAAAVLTMAVAGPQRGLLPAAVLGSIAAAAQASRLGNLPITSTDLRHGVVRLGASRLALASVGTLHTGAALAVSA
jgi:rfaE bifunctional protein nucleotidyltransferase chain/domain